MTVTAPARPDTTTTTNDTMVLAPACLARADHARSVAEANRITPVDGHAAGVAYRLGWMAPAASEYRRAALQAGINAAAVWPEDADRIMHWTAGAAIIGTLCGCMTPAGHRDALGKYAQGRWDEATAAHAA